MTPLELAVGNAMRKRTTELNPFWPVTCDPMDLAEAAVAAVTEFYRDEHTTIIHVDAGGNQVPCWHKEVPVLRDKAGSQ